MLSNNPSSPVGFSGAKNRCGRSQLSSSDAVVFFVNEEPFSGFVGVQSISSSLTSGFRGVCTGAACIEGKPNTWLTRDITGLDDKDKDSSASCSESSGGGGFGVVDRVSGRGVPERDLSNLWE